MPTINRDVCTDAQARLQEALNQIGEELGLTCVIRSASYSSDIRFTIAMSPKQTKNEQATADRQLFLFYAKAFDGDPSWYGQTIRIGKDEYIITGVFPKSRKNRFRLIRTKDNKEYATSARTIKAALEGRA